ncbi:MAG TPA: HAD-IIIA family hydrolase [Cyclobacteriaceae bacterium]|jgi:D-glycero-D-manno-heptose 1,7-bisphosphate phosphatase|nr:HAD-IIIA family hydrolase [Cyclobacteriaceae bacterium]
METVTNLSPSHKLRPALCLDFDGTIRRSPNGNTFIKNYQDIELIPGMEEKIWSFRNKGYLILGISNQAGVAHGFKLPMEIELELQTTLNLFKENPFHIVKHCYHDGKGKIEPYNHRSLLRKPDIGMLAVMEHDAWNEGFVIDWDNSLFVGDRPEDQECARRAGMPFYHVDDFKGLDD